MENEYHEEVPLRYKRDSGILERSFDDLLIEASLANAAARNKAATGEKELVCPLTGSKFKVGAKVKTAESVGFHSNSEPTDEYTDYVIDVCAGMLIVGAEKRLIRYPHQCTLLDE